MPFLRYNDDLPIDDAHFGQCTTRSNVHFGSKFRHNSHVSRRSLVIKLKFKAISIKDSLRVKGY